MEAWIFLWNCIRLEKHDSIDVSRREILRFFCLVGLGLDLYTLGWAIGSLLDYRASEAG